MSDNTTTIIWIVAAAIAAIVVVVGLALVARSKRAQSRREEANRLRAELETERRQVEKRHALAEETEARARAAEAEAEAKAAEARRLRERASVHHESVATAREDLEDRRKHVDHIDPDVKARKGDGVDSDGAEGVDRVEAGDAKLRAHDDLPDRQVVGTDPRVVESERPVVNDPTAR